MDLLHPLPSSGSCARPGLSRLCGAWTAALALSLALAGATSCAGNSGATSAEPASTAAAASAPAGPLVVKPGGPAIEAEGTARGDSPMPPCAGHVPSAAQFQMELPENNLAMTVEVEGERLALQVRAGKSKWCGKAEGGKVSVGRGAWSKGTYDILVGTEDAGGSRPFKLKIREEPR